jgi:glycerol uptake facilitator-like aquaporin
LLCTKEADGLSLPDQEPDVSQALISGVFCTTILVCFVVKIPRQKDSSLVAHLHLGGMFVADHELQNAAGYMDDPARLSAPQHLHLNTWFDAHGYEAISQDGMRRQSNYPDQLTFLC